MKVWVVQTYGDYDEGDTIAAVFSKEDDARRYAEALGNSDAVEMTVDEFAPVVTKDVWRASYSINPMWGNKPRVQLLRYTKLAPDADRLLATPPISRDNRHYYASMSSVDKGGKPVILATGTWFPDLLSAEVYAPDRESCLKLLAEVLTHIDAPAGYELIWSDAEV